MSTNAKQYLEKNADKLTLGTAIRAIRLCEGISQTNFAKKLKVSTQYLCDLEHNRKIVSAKKAIKFARILDHSPEQFVTLAIQDSLNHDGIHMVIEIKAA